MAVSELGRELADLNYTEHALCLVYRDNLRIERAFLDIIERHLDSSAALPGAHPAP